MTDVAYIRLSPNGEPASKVDKKLDEQKEKILEEYDIPDEDIYIDRGVSGKIPPEKRDAFRKMMEDIAENEDIDRVVCYTGDRLSRDMAVGPAMHWGINGMLRLMGRKSNVEFVASSDDIDFQPLGDDATPGDHFDRALYFYNAQQERKKTAEKTQHTIDRKQDAFQPTGAPPNGINSNRVVLGAETPTFYLPEPDQDPDEEDGEYHFDEKEYTYDTFEKAITTLNKWHHGDYKMTELGKEMGFSKPWQRVKGILNSRWKYFQAYHAARDHSEFDSFDVEIDFDLEEPEEKVLSAIQVPHIAAGDD